MFSQTQLALLISLLILGYMYIHSF